MAELTELRDRCATKHPSLSVTVAEVGGHEWVEITATVGPVASYSAWSVLWHNFDLALGQLKVSGENLVLWQSLPPGTLEHFDEAAEAIATEATKIREMFEANKGTAAPGAAEPTLD